MSTSKRKYKYAPATPADIVGILEVQKFNNLLHRKLEVAREEVEADGFLVHKVSGEQWVSFLKDFEDEVAAFVCKDGAEVIGYAIGYKLDWHRNLNPDWIDSVYTHAGVDALGELCSGKALYYRQQAVMLGRKRQGIGSKLNAMMSARARELGCTHTLGEILKKPYLNRASYPGTSSRGVEIGEIFETYHGAPYTWALVKFPLVPE